MESEATAPERSALILVVEDEGILGMEIERVLSDAGHRVAGPVASCAAARIWLGVHRPDFAIVDAKLDDGFCEEVARDLEGARVPFVVCSGWTDLAPYRALASAPRLSKPVDFARLLGIVDLALSTGEVRT